jgi:hypothetical protein
VAALQTPRATRAARHTMGARQRQTVKAPAPKPVAPDTSIVVAAPSGVTMTASTASTNGVAHAGAT